MGLKPRSESTDKLYVSGEAASSYSICILKPTGSADSFPLKSGMVAVTILWIRFFVRSQAVPEMKCSASMNASQGEKDDLQASLLEAHQRRKAACETCLKRELGVATALMKNNGSSKRGLLEVNPDACP